MKIYYCLKDILATERILWWGTFKQVFEKKPGKKAPKKCLRKITSEIIASSPRKIAPRINATRKIVLLVFCCSWYYLTVSHF